MAPRAHLIRTPSAVSASGAAEGPATVPRAASCQPAAASGRSAPVNGVEATGSGGGSSGSRAAAPPLDAYASRLANEVLADDYEKDGEAIGEGTYGTVWRAKCSRTGRTVAMKRVVLRPGSEREGFPLTAIREVRALRRLQHDNIVSLLDVCVGLPSAGGGPGTVYLIFEYAPSDLTGLMEYRKQKLKPPEIKCLTKQFAAGLAYCHERDIMHRDLKPSNILITAGGQLKLCDFGLSRTFAGLTRYSTRVITIWYRPPELLLGADVYDLSVDVWSAGCIFGELLAGRALFPESAEGKMFHKICERCGATAEAAWPEELRMLPQWGKLAPGREARGAGAGVNTGAPASTVFRDVSQKFGVTPAAVDLLRAMLQLDPQRRIRAAGILKHAYFAEAPLPCEPNEIKMNNPALSCHELEVKKLRERQQEAREAQLRERQQEAQRAQGGKRPGPPPPAKLPADSPAKRPRPA